MKRIFQSVAAIVVDFHKSGILMTAIAEIVKEVGKKIFLKMTFLKEEKKNKRSAKKNNQKIAAVFAESVVAI
ncbi:MAG: hypothetical protein J6J24_04425 [Clostridia bacterium]|nr:hypothetical protein [Clostridia bacterium]